ncbi:MAG: cell division protein FtsN [Candidatus Endobugula sp.]|jgi:cell division protein FtsN
MSQDFAKKKTPSRKSASKPAQPQKSSTSRATKTSDKSKTNARRTTTIKKTPPFWAWIMTSICLVGFGVFLSALSDQTDNSSSAGKNTVNTAVINTISDDDGAIKVRSQIEFDFYKILKGKEVNVDDRIVEKTPEPKNVIYYLQVGSFKQPSDADTLRARLLLQGLSVGTESTTGKNGQEWHRVVAGPFNTRSKLAKARSVLASKEISSIVLKRKK